MPTAVQHVLERFPQHATLISELLAVSEEFRSLCEDYALVLETIARLERQGRPASDGTLDEYRIHRLELELDIAEALTGGLL